MNSKKERKAASIHQRLLNKARESGRPFNELLQYYAMERFIFRVSHSPYAEKFILKGALLLRTLGISEIRPTRDIDLLGPNQDSVDTLKGMLAECCRLEVEEDGLWFDANDISSEEIRENQAYQGFRFQIRGKLGNANVSIQVDMGFGDIVTPAPMWVEYPTILDDQKPRIKAYTIESAIAEKYHAMVDLNLLNSRMKDFFDIYYLSTELEFEGAKLQQAISQTFRRRKTKLPKSLPTAFTSSFYGDEVKQKQWQAFHKKINANNLPTDFESIVSRIKRLLWPVKKNIIKGDSLDMTWSPEKGWH